MTRRAQAIGLITAALLFGAGCPGSSANGQGRSNSQPKEAVAPRPDISAEHYVPPPMARGKVFFQDAYGTRKGIDVELAATTDQRTRGMMWRREMKPGTGMLFLFPNDEDHSFWMRNTLIPLDMVFIAHDGTIVGIVENAEPRTLTSRHVGRISRHVLEVPGGWASRAGMRTGTKVELQLPAGLTPEG